jgi:hypothetical protein
VSRDIALQAIKYNSYGFKKHLKKGVEKKLQAEIVLSEYEYELGTW